MNLIPWRNKQKDNVEAQHDLAPGVGRLRSEMSRMIDRFFDEPFGDFGDNWLGTSGWGPSLDVSETDSHVVVKAEIPGVDPKAVDVSISGNILTISGEKSETKRRKDESYYHSERRFGSFRRNIQLPTYVDAEDVSAEHANGVLTVQLAKSKTAAPKRVPVKSI